MYAQTFIICVFRYCLLYGFEYTKIGTKFLKLICKLLKDINYQLLVFNCLHASNSDGVTIRMCDHVNPAMIVRLTIIFNIYYFR